MGSLSSTSSQASSTHSSFEQAVSIPFRHPHFHPAPPRVPLEVSEPSQCSYRNQRRPLSSSHSSVSSARSQQQQHSQRAKSAQGTPSHSYSRLQEQQPQSSQTQQSPQQLSSPQATEVASRRRRSPLRGPQDSKAPNPFRAEAVAISQRPSPVKVSAPSPKPRPEKHPSSHLQCSRTSGESPSHSRGPSSQSSQLQPTPQKSQHSSQQPSQLPSSSSEGTRHSKVFSLPPPPLQLLKPATAPAPEARHRSRRPSS